MIVLAVENLRGEKDVEKEEQRGRDEVYTQGCALDTITSEERWSQGSKASIVMALSVTSGIAIDPRANQGLP